MKNYLSATAIVLASFCFAASIAKERTATISIPENLDREWINEQDTVRATPAPMPVPNQKRDMGDTSRMMRQDRRTDTTFVPPIDTHKVPTQKRQR